jgi:LysR family transcriptional activator of nhaA
MQSFNYHHLRYFWAVAKEGSLRKASERLHVSQPSISAQIQALQESLGEPLLRRHGRGLALTESGRLVYGYAEEIFSLGEELLSAVKGQSSGRRLKFNVGLADSIPKLVASEILRPVFSRPEPVHVECREGKVDVLLEQLAAMRLDIVLADEPAPAGLMFKSFNHPLGSCGVAFCAAPALAARLRRQFPQSLQEAPALLPTQNTNLRRSLDQWFHAKGIEPKIAGEFEDAAMSTVVAADGFGYMPIASVIGKEVLARYPLEIIGVTHQCQAQFFAISAERRLTHPAVLLITQNAQSRLFPRFS